MITHVMSTMLSRHLKKDERPDATDASSRTNLRYLSIPQKVECIQQLHKSVRVSHQRAERLQNRIKSLVDKEGIVVEDELHQDLTEIVQDNTPKIEESYPPDSFARLFWEQQTKACRMKVSSL